MTYNMYPVNKTPKASRALGNPGRTDVRLGGIHPGGGTGIFGFSGLEDAFSGVEDVQRTLWR
jgi:hypothetical protein